MSFDRALIITFVVLAVVLLLTTLFQVRFGLAPLKRISESLAAIRGGTAEKLEGAFPGRDRAARARDQCAARCQPRDRRARAHPCRQSRACAQDADLGDGQRGARARRRSAGGQGRRADQHHARSGDAPSRARAHRRAPHRGRHRHRRRAGGAGARPHHGEDPPRQGPRRRARRAGRGAVSRRATGPRGDGRQPRRQRVQMGERARRDRSRAGAVGARRARSCASWSTTTVRG